MLIGSELFFVDVGVRFQPIFHIRKATLVLLSSWWERSENKASHNISTAQYFVIQHFAP